MKFWILRHDWALPLAVAWDRDEIVIAVLCFHWVWYLTNRKGMVKY